MTAGTLTVHRDLEQGTEAWLQARCGLLTASIIGTLITPSTVHPAASAAATALVTRLAAERITGRVEDVRQTGDMLRGTLDEPYARDAYAQHRGVTVEQVGLMVREVDGARLGYSPDGLVGDAGLIEIKSRRPGVQLDTILRDAVPPANRAQLQAGLWVSGREWIDYVSYCGGTALYILRVTPDPRWQDVITQVVHETEQGIAEVIADYREHTAGLPIPPYIDHFETLEF